MVGEDVADGLPPPEEGSPGRSSGKRTRNRTTADKCLGAAGGVLITKQESRIWEMGGGLQQMGVAVRSMMGGTEVESMGGPPQDTHGDSHKDSLLDLKLSGEHSSRFFRPSLRSRNKSGKLRFACNFGRGVPYFRWHGPSYFAGRLANRESASRPLSTWNNAESAFCKICTASSLCLAGGPCFYSGRVAPLFSR